MEHNHGKFTHTCRYCDYKVTSISHAPTLAMENHLRKWHYDNVKSSISHFNQMRNRQNLDPYMGELLMILKKGEIKQ